MEQAVADCAWALVIRGDPSSFLPRRQEGALPADSIDAIATFSRLESLPLPAIAALAGAVLRGGLQLTLAGDFIFAGELAETGAVEICIGLAPLLGAVQHLLSLAGPTAARETAMLGRRYSP